MKNWLYQHWRNLGVTLGRLARAPIANLFNIGVIGIALALPLGFYVVLVNVQGVAREHAPVPQLSIFLALDAQAADVGEIEMRLRKTKGIDRFRYISREQALADLKARSGLADVLAGLNRNPLPDGFVVDAHERSVETLEQLRKEFKAWPKVEFVELDSAWARRLDAVLNLGRLVVLVLGTLLAFAMVAITFNTIRLQILTQREEIEVAKLIGATNPFIRRPFLYYGALLGMAGGGAAWLITWAGIQVLNQGLAGLAALYGATFALQHISLLDSASLCVFAGVLGWLGAWLSVSRHLGAFDPR